MAMGFAGLCATHHMMLAEITNFAALCSAFLQEVNLLCWKSLQSERKISADWLLNTS
jgi:hypothetical protein